AVAENYLTNLPPKPLISPDPSRLVLGHFAPWKSAKKPPSRRCVRTSGWRRRGGGKVLVWTPRICATSWPSLSFASRRRHPATSASPCPSTRASRPGSSWRGGACSNHGDPASEIETHCTVVEKPAVRERRCCTLRT